MNPIVQIVFLIVMFEHLREHQRTTAVQFIVFLSAVAFGVALASFALAAYRVRRKRQNVREALENAVGHGAANDDEEMFEPDEEDEGEDEDGDEDEAEDTHVDKRP